MGAQDMEMIKVEIQKADVVSRFLMKNKILMDAIQRLYRGMRRQIGLIDAELKRKKYPKEIILLIIGYLLNYERPLVISFEGAATLCNWKQCNDADQIVESVDNDLPQKHIQLWINGSI